VSSHYTKITRRGPVLVVAIDNPPVNTLSPGVPEAIGAAIDEAEGDAGVVAIVVRGAGRMFVAGADIGRLAEAAWGDETAAPDWHDLFRRIEDCRKPVVMAIHGSALGGGLELAMAGHYRVAAGDAQIGQPEVNLGIIPGAEGTQRLPRLAGVARALEMCVTGKPVPAMEALEAGIVDAIVDGDLTTEAVAFAVRVAHQRSHVKTRDRRDRLGDPAAATALLASARERATTDRRFETAPLKAVDAVEAAATMPFDEGCQRERELFFECLRSEQAKALIHVFFSERALKKLGGGPSAESARAAGDTLMRLVIAEARHLAEHGVRPTQIDRALTNFGMAAGVLGAHAPVVRHRPRTLADDEIVERLVYTIVNQGARALEAGTVVCASDIDATLVGLHGFPRWRGGPMFYADRVGLGAVVDRLTAFREQDGDRWRPAALLVELARENSTFREHDLRQKG
jgi:enoyl-CoA hydratase/carnithine racemase